MPEKHKSCESHCCARHGCKYGHEDCPVVMTRLEQEGPCEYCPTLEELQAQKEELDAEFKHWELLNARRIKDILAAERARLRAQKEKDVR